MEESTTIRFTPAERAAYVDHDLRLGGAGADVEKEHAVDAAECCSDAVSVVEIPDGDVDAIG